jgi:hypothetical protein
MHIHEHICTLLSTYTHPWTHMHIIEHIYTSVNTYAHPWTHMHIIEHIYTSLNTYAHYWAHIHIREHIYTSVNTIMHILEHIIPLLEHIIHIHEHIYHHLEHNYAHPWAVVRNLFPHDYKPQKLPSLCTIPKIKPHPYCRLILLCTQIGPTYHDCSQFVYSSKEPISPRL